jgi:predicted DNA-binding transcriptional regulator AlpA
MSFVDFLDTDQAPKGPVAQLAKAVADKVIAAMRLEAAAGDDLIFDTKAAARFCGLSERTLEKMRAEGTGPECIRLSAASVGYRLGALREWSRSRPRHGRRAMASIIANASDDSREDA